MRLWKRHVPRASLSLRGPSRADPQVRQAVLAITLLVGATAVAQPTLPDGLYAEITTSKGKIVARLEADLAPLTVANFVGLAEGTIANAAFDPGHPFYDGSVFHRVVPGHVIQTGVPQSERAKNPGYTFPNEIHARLSHNHAGALNMANGGPNTNAAQFCITLGDRSYLDGDYIVFGDVMEGLDVVMRIVQGDIVEKVRILRVGTKAEAFHPTTESFRAMLRTAEQRVTEHVAKKRQAEREWIAGHYPKAAGPADGVLTELFAAGAPKADSPLRFRYRGTQLRYMGHVIGREGPPFDLTYFVSGDNGIPGVGNSPQVFTLEPGKTKINAGLDGVIATMKPGERRVVIVPPALGYGRGGFYPPEVPGRKRFVISPNVMLVYEVEAQ